jgi:nudix-type nucleoside diphosphatase (YffH/AdpP family)
MPSRVDIERQKMILDDFFKVEEAFLTFEKFDGSMSPRVRRLSFERGDSVAALLHHKARGSVILVNQFKYPAWSKGPGWITEVVAGMIDPGESPESAARREILEETGYRSDTLAPIATFYVSPGGSSERIWLYCAEISEGGPGGKGGGAAGENEDIALVELPLREAFRQIDAGEIVDAKTMIALMWLRAKSG